jgi:hypothetical protein
MRTLAVLFIVVLVALSTISTVSAQMDKETKKELKRLQNLRAEEEDGGDPELAADYDKQIADLLKGNKKSLAGMHEKQVGNTHKFKEEKQLNTLNVEARQDDINRIKKQDEFRQAFREIQLRQAQGDSNRVAQKKGLEPNGMVSYTTTSDYTRSAQSCFVQIFRVGYGGKLLQEEKSIDIKLSINNSVKLFLPDGDYCAIWTVGGKVVMTDYNIKVHAGEENSYDGPKSQEWHSWYEPPLSELRRRY